MLFPAQYIFPKRDADLKLCLQADMKPQAGEMNELLDMMAKSPLILGLIGQVKLFNPPTYIKTA